MRILTCVLVLSLQFFAPPVSAQQKIHDEYTKQIQKFTTDPHFITKHVNYMPYSSRIPMPLEVLGHIAGGVERGKETSIARDSLMDNTANRKTSGTPLIPNSTMDGHTSYRMNNMFFLNPAGQVDTARLISISATGRRTVHGLMQ